MDHREDGQNSICGIYLHSLSKSKKMCLKLCGLGVKIKMKMDHNIKEDGQSLNPEIYLCLHSKPEKVP